MHEIITSTHNPKVKLARLLNGRPKDRRKENAFVAEGVRLVEEAFDAGWPFRFVLYAEGLNRRGQALVAELSDQGIETDEVFPDLLQSASATETSQGILAVLDYSQIEIPKAPTFILIPDQIRDPGNLGTLLRTAAAGGVDAVIIPPETTDPFSPKVVRAGMGAHFCLRILSLDWKEIERLCVSSTLAVYLANMDGQSCWQANLNQPLALIVGGEAEGASIPARALATDTISIPMIGNVESLNAGVAGSVLMFEVVRQRRSAV